MLEGHVEEIFSNYGKVYITCVGELKNVQLIFLLMLSMFVPDVVLR